MSERRVVIIKHARTLTLFDGEEEVLQIPVVLGKNPADKLRSRHARGQLLRLL
jgi:hypothetical protein